MGRESYLFIVNPTAAGGRAVSRIERVERLLYKHHIDYTLRFTRSPGHATRIAEEAAYEGGYGTVVASGGDGTANEVLNGLMNAAAWGGRLPDMGILPIGRGNDFAYGAGIPSSIEEAMRILIGGGGYGMDVGLIRGGIYPEGRYFGNGVGIGFDTIVGLEAAKAVWAPGFMGYVYGALKTFLLFPPAPQLSLSYGQERFEGCSHQISIMNGKRMGGTFFMAPNGSNNDGLFDLCMATRALKRGEMFRAILQYSKGKQLDNPLFHHALSDGFTIEAPEGGLICHADGETITTDGTHLQVELIPSALVMRGVEQRVEPELRNGGKRSDGGGSRE